MKKKSAESKSNSFGIAIGVIVVFLVGIVLLSNFNNSTNSTSTESNFNAETSTPIEGKSSENGDASPFWTGTSTLQICKKPYYATSDCSFLTTKLIDADSVQIYLEDGSSTVNTDLTCYNGGNSSAGEGYVFCRSYDSSGGQWDIFPSWVVQ